MSFPPASGGARDGGAVSPRAARHMPWVTDGLRVGLFGGSFNPAHEAHRAASLLALRRLRLDRVWWLVTPGNPLKDNRALPPLEERVAIARRVARHPRIDVTGFEADLGVRYSYQSVEYLARRLPTVRFVWIMGADNLARFDRWQRWRAIADLMPMAVVDRMGESLAATALVGLLWVGATLITLVVPWTVASHCSSLLKGSSPTQAMLTRTAGPRPAYQTDSIDIACDLATADH